MYQHASKGKTRPEGLKSSTSTANKNHDQTGIKRSVQLMPKSPFSPLQMQLRPQQESSKAQPIQMMPSEEQARLAPGPARPNKTGIPMQMKEKFENLSGFSFDDVKVHYNSDKPAQLHALAYTQGNQVYIAPGQEKHLGHELGHVVQQKQGIVRPTAWIGGMPVNDSPTLEKEADSGVIQRKNLINVSDCIQMLEKPVSVRDIFIVDSFMRNHVAICADSKNISKNEKRTIASQVIREDGTLILPRTTIMAVPSIDSLKIDIIFAIRKVKNLDKITIGETFSVEFTAPAYTFMRGGSRTVLGRTVMPSGFAEQNIIVHASCNARGKYRIFHLESATAHELAAPPPSPDMKALDLSSFPSIESVHKPKRS